MDRKTHVNAFVLQHPRDLTDRILRLRNSHAVPDDDNNALSRRQCVSRFLYGSLGDRTFDFVFRVVSGCYAAEENVGQAPVHGDAHDV